MAGWTFAELWETAAEMLPDAPALVHAERRISWGAMDRRADGVASWLLDLGVEQQDKVAQYLYNCPEYMESMFATFKAGMAPVNTNYRYGDQELLYLWDNADTVAVVFHGVFADRIDGLREGLRKVRGWLWVDDGSGPCPSWATPYEDAAARRPGRQRGPWGVDGDHVYMLYTGGTTGMPKGVMWRQDDLVMILAERSPAPLPAQPDYEFAGTTLAAPGPVAVPACPQMHGTGGITSIIALMQGGSVVTLPGRTFDPRELLDSIEREKVNVTAIVGDAFAKPMLRALDAEPGRWDISSLLAISSSGVMWSNETKAGLLRHHPGMILMDSFASSEALGMGTSLSGGGQASPTATFQLGPAAVVVSVDGRLIEPGSDEVGMVGVGGRLPVGYYKDPDKTAATFRVIDGMRYSVPGDWATVDADGTIHLLGRGSVCINTGGEKVFPEEVEESLKRDPAVRDAVVVGVPDEQWGEAIVALVEPHDGVASIDTASLIAHVKSELSSYKAPKWVFETPSIGRSPNGKVDYKASRESASELVAELQR
jgi:acyl-CoA synthetase (AMP-forming)/AMP-acid ligase II